MSIPSRSRRSTVSTPPGPPGPTTDRGVSGGPPLDLDGIETALAEHPDVERAAVTAEVRDGRIHVTARVVSTAPDGDRSDEDDRVARWRSAYDTAYDEPTDAELGEDFGIWRDGVTGLPMPVTDMHEWRDTTVARIRALEPRRLLEVGAGTGLLLRDLAPHCRRYHATDLSEVAVRRLREQTAADPVLAGRVHVEHRAADDVRGWEPGSFDVVVLNSVSHYLPGGEHLEGVLRASFALLAAGGHLFVGDVRNLALLRCSRAVAGLGAATPDSDTEALAAVAERQAAGELELLVDPDWFVRLAAEIGSPCTVEVQLRRGRAHNEMTRYRYDVTFSRTAAVVDAHPVLDLRWGEDLHDLDAFGALLATTGCAVRVTGVPNARLRREASALRLLAGGGEPAAARRVLAEAPGGVEPEDVWSLGDRSGRDVRVRWSHTADGTPDTLEVVVARAGCAPPAPAVGGPPRPLVSDPGSAARDRALVADLRRRLGRLLPDHAAPAVVVLVPSPPSPPSP